MRKSKVETAETRLRIVRKATAVFKNKGLGATSIGDIMAAADLTPGGFYRHFESKEHLIAEANQTAFHELFAMLEKKIKGKPPRQALEVIVTSYLRQLGRDGHLVCPLAIVGSELGQANNQIKTVAAEGHVRLQTMIAHQIQLLRGPRAAEIASAITSLLVGAVTLARLDTRGRRSVLASAQKAIILILQLAP